MKLAGGTRQKLKTSASFFIVFKGTYFGKCFVAFGTGEYLKTHIVIHHDEYVGELLKPAKRFAWFSSEFKLEIKVDQNIPQEDLLNEINMIFELF